MAKIKMGILIFLVGFMFTIVSIVSAGEWDSNLNLDVSFGGSDVDLGFFDTSPRMVPIFFEFSKLDVLPEDIDPLQSLIALGEEWHVENILSDLGLHQRIISADSTFNSIQVLHPYKDAIFIFSDLAQIAAQRLLNQNETVENLNVDSYASFLQDYVLPLEALEDAVGAADLIDLVFRDTEEARNQISGERYAGISEAPGEFTWFPMQILDQSPADMWGFYDAFMLATRELMADFPEESEVVYFNFDAADIGSNLNIEEIPAIEESYTMVVVPDMLTFMQRFPIPASASTSDEENYVDLMLRVASGYGIVQIEGEKIMCVTADNFFKLFPVPENLGLKNQGEYDNLQNSLYSGSIVEVDLELAVVKGVEQVPVFAEDFGISEAEYSGWQGCIGNYFLAVPNEIRVLDLLSGEEQTIEPHKESLEQLIRDFTVACSISGVENQDGMLQFSEYHITRNLEGQDVVKIERSIDDDVYEAKVYSAGGEFIAGLRRRRIGSDAAFHHIMTFYSDEDVMAEEIVFAGTGDSYIESLPEYQQAGVLRYKDSINTILSRMETRIDNLPKGQVPAGIIGEVEYYLNTDGSSELTYGWLISPLVEEGITLRYFEEER